MVLDYSGFDLTIDRTNKQFPTTDKKGTYPTQKIEMGDPFQYTDTSIETP